MYKFEGIPDEKIHQDLHAIYLGTVIFAMLLVKPLLDKMKKEKEDK